MPLPRREYFIWQRRNVYIRYKLSIYMKIVCLTDMMVATVRAHSWALYFAGRYSLFGVRSAVSQKKNMLCSTFGTLKHSSPVGERAFARAVARYYYLYLKYVMVFLWKIAIKSIHILQANQSQWKKKLPVQWTFIKGRSNGSQTDFGSVDHCATLLTWHCFCPRCEWKSGKNPVKSWR